MILWYFLVATPTRLTEPAAALVDSILCSGSVWKVACSATSSRSQDGFQCKHPGLFDFTWNGMVYGVRRDSFQLVLNTTPVPTSHRRSISWERQYSIGQIPVCWHYILCSTWIIVMVSFHWFLFRFLVRLILIHVLHLNRIFNILVTSSHTAALTCISAFFVLLFQPWTRDLCVCPAFSALTLWLTFHWPLLKSWTLNPVTPYLELLQTPYLWKGSCTLLVKTWSACSHILTLFKDLICVCVCVRAFVL